MIVQKITRVDKMISQSESGKLIADISYKYIANRETEQMNVMINMNFDRTF